MSVQHHDEERIMTFGRNIWEQTYAAGLDGDQTYQWIVDRIACDPLQTNGDELRARRLDMGAVHTGFFAVSWADAGYPKIVLAGHKFAAAMACTAAHRDVEVRWPWEAFMMAIPNGILPSRTPGVSYVSLRCWKANTKYAFALFDDRGAEIQCMKGSLEDLLFGESWEDARSDVLFNAASLDERILLAAQRLIVGALYCMQHTDNFLDRDGALKQPRRDPRSGPPKHRIVTVGRSIAMDARPALAQALGGQGSLPSVQSLVRGHYKRQPVGPGGRDRKVIWLEPYWRGPEDAPIAFRPHVVRHPE